MPTPEELAAIADRTEIHSDDNIWWNLDFVRLIKEETFNTWKAKYAAHMKKAKWLNNLEGFKGYVRGRKRYTLPCWWHVAHVKRNTAEDLKRWFRLYMADMSKDAWLEVLSKIGSPDGDYWNDDRCESLAFF